MNDWRDYAACAGANPDDWFPAASDHDTRDRALAICARCPVVADCAQAADEMHAEGVWGGTWRPSAAELCKQRSQRKDWNSKTGRRPVEITVENFNDTRSEHGGLLTQAAMRLRLEPESLKAALHRARRRGIDVEFTDDMGRAS